MKKTLYIESLGCPKNRVDSEVFVYIAQQKGYVLTDDYSTASIVMVNTCSFLEASIGELCMVLQQLIESLSLGKKQKLIVTGCIMKRYLSEMQENFPEVDYWIGLKDFAAFDALLSGNLLPNYKRAPLEQQAYTYLRISDGCSNHCAYCTIPSIRGELHSIPKEKLIDEANELAQQGYTELIIIAQDTTAYGLDLYGRNALGELLIQLHEIEQFRWIRLMYLHPKHITEELVTTIASLPRLLHSFEMPLQHVNDDILAAMGRSYTKADIINTLELFRTHMPDSVFRTTFITGFPSETPKQFQELKDFITEYPFLRLGAFCYSREVGTRAHDLPRQVTSRTAEKRQTELLLYHEQLATGYLEAMVGSVIDVLVEDYGQEDDNSYGRAWFDAPDIDGVVSFCGVTHAPGSIVSVMIEDVIGVDLYGTEV